MANLLALYPVLAGKPLKPAMEEIPTTEPLLANKEGSAYFVQ